MKKLKVLVGCEFSGIVRDAFFKKGHDAISCDLLPTESPGPHFQGDIFDLDFRLFDLIIMHPPCTCLSVSGNRTYAAGKPKHYMRIESAKWTEMLWNKSITACNQVCFENPVGVLPGLTNMPKPQYIQPWEFGHPETKKTGLWLHGLPELKPTDIVEPKFIIGKDGKKYSPVHYLSRGSAQKYYGMSREKVRSLTYKNIAKAMENQWGELKS